MENATKKNIVVICGPSGSGKTTLSTIFEAQGASRIVTSTTRKPRNTSDGHMERDGVDYNFMETNDFLQAREQGLFIESAQFGRNFYGMTFDAIEDAFRNSLNSNGNGNAVAVCVMEINGVLAIRQAFKQDLNGVFHNTGLKTVFMDVPLDISEERLRNRDTDIDAATLAWRIENMKHEAGNIIHFDDRDADANYEKRYILKNPELNDLKTFARTVIERGSPGPVVKPINPAPSP